MTVIARQNVGLAIVYNVVAVPVAITGILTPSMAALAMLASSVSVALNSLRLSRLAATPSIEGCGGRIDVPGEEPAGQEAII